MPDAKGRRAERAEERALVIIGHSSLDGGRWPVDRAHSHSSGAQLSQLSQPLCPVRRPVPYRSLSMPCCLVPSYPRPLFADRRSGSASHSHSTRHTLSLAHSLHPPTPTHAHHHTHTTSTPTLTRIPFAPRQHPPSHTHSPHITLARLPTHHCCNTYTTASRRSIPQHRPCPRPDHDPAYPASDPPRSPYHRFTLLHSSSPFPFIPHHHCITTAVTPNPTPTSVSLLSCLEPNLVACLAAALSPPPRPQRQSHQTERGARPTNQPRRRLTRSSRRLSNLIRHHQHHLEHHTSTRHSPIVPFH